MTRSVITTLLVVSLSAGCDKHIEPSSAATATALGPSPASRSDLAEEDDLPAPNPQEIHAAVNGRSDEIRQCYMLGTFRNSQLEGTVNVVFTIEPSGKVTETVDGGSNMPDPEVVDCVLGVFAKLEFKKGRYSPTQVEYPITFGKS